MNLQQVVIGLEGPKPVVSFLRHNTGGSWPQLTVKANFTHLQVYLSQAAANQIQVWVPTR